jgi:hypothetical protein
VKGSIVPEDPMSRSRRPNERSRRFGEERRRAAEAEKRWRQSYEPEIVEQLRWDQRYWIVRVGALEFAFTSYDGYVDALKKVWGAGLVPGHGATSVRGTELPAAAPALCAVDDDILSHIALRRGD